MEQESKRFIIVGASGAMGLLALKEASKNGHKITAAIVGPEDDTSHVHNHKGIVVECSKIDRFNWSTLSKRFKKLDPPIIIDASSEKVVNDNYTKYYRKLDFPIIFITTGVDPKILKGHRAPILLASPNCSLALVSVLKMFSELDVTRMKTWHPEQKIYYGITESHQGPDIARGFMGKPGISATANAVDGYLKNVGCERRYFEPIRSRKIQLALNIKPENLDGHAWHEYHFMFIESSDAVIYLKSQILSIFNNLQKYENFYAEISEFKMHRVSIDETLEFIFHYDENNFWFSHNVNGRRPYIDGLFSQNVIGTFFDMIKNKENNVITMFDLL